NGLVDYIFTDPPYDSAIQYGELCYLWVAWLKMDKSYLQTMCENEVIHNKRQNKDFEVYHSMLKSSFKCMYDVLQENGYLTVTFHNPTFKVRNATIRAGIAAGFDFRNIHHQELARSSPKSLLQPFGSAQGDFYLRFHKSDSAKVKKYEEIDEERFDKIVFETTKEILAERWEPTPFAIINNAIDPKIAEYGYFSSLHTGLDVKTVLKNHLDFELTLVEEKVGGAKGKLWWFKDPSIIPHHDIPLSERVEKTILRELKENYKVTFTDIWRKIGEEFPNSLTSDKTRIDETLKEYATPISKGYWALKPIVKQRVEQHSEMISKLAEVGQARGFSVWVGVAEQPKYYISPVGSAKTLLRTYCKPTKLLLKDLEPKHLRKIKNIDLIWYKNNKIHSTFEIEHTTMLTEAIERCSNIPYKNKRYIVIPEERENKLLSKLDSPMFRDRFKNDNWEILYYDALRVNYNNLLQRKVEIENIVNKKITKTKGTGGQQMILTI
ncbi:MAG: hypothetical protein MUO85_09945, partial [candidate division Zixibacteria bacterium]|nr:hypothetical protein [candidate division Zixibacteria bacterium]